MQAGKAADEQDKPLSIESPDTLEKNPLEFQ